MDLARDILDSQLVDRHGERLGKVDGVVATWRPGHPPRLKWIEVGGRAPWRRLSRRLAQRIGRDSCRISWEKIRRHGATLRADVVAEETSAYFWERWWRRHFIGRIPGA